MIPYSNVFGKLPKRARSSDLPFRFSFPPLSLSTLFLHLTSSPSKWPPPLRAPIFPGWTRHSWPLKHNSKFDKKEWFILGLMVFKLCTDTNIVA
ncbi:hypothetical protein Ahy_B05g076668 isoform A [Arachis hypogaea]|uniref:Uncharacterized protein n=1 Tax=Arachis hypogaea TaxID=3818 RepID=A0A444Z3S6_ARAHY|nr:hypothetical protein Ahy_B05g076668 isoform A [Arachis hypogaea]